MTAARRELACLRSQWKLWKRGTHPTLHDGYTLVCPSRCGLPACEACAVTAFRAGRMAEIQARASAIS